jgi:starch synthase
VIVPERDARGLAAALTALLRDPRRAAGLGQAGRALVEGRFGWESAAAQFETAYDRALAFNSLTR